MGPQIQSPHFSPGKEGRGLREEGKKEGRGRTGKGRAGGEERAHSQQEPERVPPACSPAPRMCLSSWRLISVQRASERPSESPAEPQTVGAALARWAQSPRWARLRSASAHASLRPAARCLRLAASGGGDVTGAGSSGCSPARNRGQRDQQAGMLPGHPSWKLCGVRWAEGSVCGVPPPCEGASHTPTSLPQWVALEGSQGKCHIALSPGLRNLRVSREGQMNNKKETRWREALFGAFTPAGTA